MDDCVLCLFSKVALRDATPANHIYGGVCGSSHRSNPPLEFMIFFDTDSHVVIKVVPMAASAYFLFFGRLPHESHGFLPQAH
jgi:hypothetical protein